MEALYVEARMRRKYYKLLARRAKKGITEKKGRKRSTVLLFHMISFSEKLSCNDEMAVCSFPAGLSPKNLSMPAPR